MIFNSYIFINSIFSFVFCKNYFPSFESLPPPLVYYAENSEESVRLLTCKAWPLSPLTEIKMYSTTRVMQGSKDGHPSQAQLLKAAPLHPLDSEHVQGSSVVLRSVIQARTLSKLDLHCLAKTQFGAVISRPFRVVEARIGFFPSATNMGEAHKIVKYFMHGNVAYVDCIPPISYPPADIEFKLNETTIHASHRYKYIKRPNSQRVTLLIQAFEPRDQGYYRCIATNSITRETKIDPLVQQLKIKSPSNKMSASVKMSILGNELMETGQTTSSMDVISVREGLNVTLFCVMEGAPPPHITTYKLRSSPSNQHRYISDKEFGLLSITKVSVEDEDSYICSEVGVSDSAQLKVQRRLSITQGPQDIRVNELGSPARFTCLSNDPSITPQWYFNGRIRTQPTQSGKDSSLHIPVVRKEDLGVYQCVARSQDEWVTQVASLSLKGEALMAKEDDGDIVNSGESSSVINSHGDSRGSRIKKNVGVSRFNNMSRESPSEELVSPDVYIIEDNLAVLLQWQTEDNVIGALKHYQVQYKSQKADQKLWSNTQTLENKIPDNYFYVTSRYLQAQHKYLFRISAVLQTGLSRISQWSRLVSFTHIYPVQPVIGGLYPFNATHVRVQWKYSYTAQFPVTCYKLLVRKTTDKSSSVQYSKYWYFIVSNPADTEALVGPLTPADRYQALVYGIKETEPRKVTLYSAETVFEITSTRLTGHSSSASNTRLMFIILGSLAGLMLLVIVVLVLMCYCRERKSLVKHRLNRYKDPAKLIHSCEQSKTVQPGFLVAGVSMPSTVSKQQQAHTDGNTVGEHSSLLSTGPDAVYYQQKRQPPSGGSGHDMSDSEGLSNQDRSSMMMVAGTHEAMGSQQHAHLSSGPLTPQQPAITYFKTPHGPASLPAGSLMRPGHVHHQQQQQQFSQQQYPPGLQYGPQILYTNAGLVFSPGNYVGAMYPHQQQQQQYNVPCAQRQDTCELRSQDGGESVYSYFSQTSTTNNNQRRDNVGGAGGLQSTVETGSQTINGTGSAGHRHHRRKRRKTSNSAGNGAVIEIGEMCATNSRTGERGVKTMYGVGHGGQREMVMYDTPPVAALAHQRDPRMMNVPPGMVLMQPSGGMVPGEQQCWIPMNNTLTRRGTPTLLVEPPRIRDYSEYGIPHNQMMVGQPHQLAHLSQQNLHLHNQHLSGGYRDAQA